MKRIAVIGSSGAGKSTFARSLQSILELPVIHLDKMFFNENWVPKETSVFRELVLEVQAGDEWIIDGNYTGTMKDRFERADAVVFLDCPTAVCFYRVMSRIIRGHGTTRPDVAEGCPERFDFEFLKYVASFRRKSRPRLIEILNDFPELPVYRARNPREAEKILGEIRQKTGGN